MESIKPLIKKGHVHYGENKVQEAEKNGKFINKIISSSNFT